MAKVSTEKKFPEVIFSIIKIAEWPKVMFLHDEGDDDDDDVMWDAT